MREQLLSYGLSNKEIDLYITALKLGDSTANRLSEITELTRSTVYDIAKSLQKKGLMGIYKREKKTFFSANNPESLITLLKEKEQAVKQIIPDLKKLIEQKPDRPVITVYKGTTGLRTAADEMLEAKEILVYGGGKNADEVFGSYTANFAAKRVEKKIILKAITGPTIPEHMQTSKVKKCTLIRTIDVFENHDTTYFIYNDTVLIWNYYQDLMAIKIDSKVFTKSQKRIFNFFWSIASK